MTVSLRPLTLHPVTSVSSQKKVYPEQELGGVIHSHAQFNPLLMLGSGLSTMSYQTRSSEKITDTKPEQSYHVQNSSGTSKFLLYKQAVLDGFA